MVSATKPAKSRPTGNSKSPVIRKESVTFSVSCSQEDLDLIKTRLQSLVVLDRSSYIVALVRRDCACPREFSIVPRDQVLSSNSGKSEATSSNSGDSKTNRET